MSGSDIALIIGALGTFVAGPMMVVWARLDAKRADAEKETKYALDRAEREAKAEAGRVAARESLTASLVKIEGKTEEVHVLVNAKSDKQEKKIDEQSALIGGLKAVITGAVPVAGPLNGPARDLAEGIEPSP